MADFQATLLGGLFMGLLISFFLYGIFLMKSLEYFFHCKEDPMWMKRLVSLVVTLETLDAPFMLIQVYHYGVTGFGRPRIIERIHWTVAGTVIIENVVVALVQGFFVYRVWVLSENSRTWLIAMSLPILAQFASIIIVTVETVTTPTWAEYQSRTENMAGINLANITTVIADTAVAVAMVYHLSRGEVYFKRTKSVLRWLIGYSVNTGVLTLLVALAIIITYAHVKNSLVYVGLVTISGKVCANSMLGALVARYILRNRLNNDSSIDPAVVSTVRFRDEREGACSVAMSIPHIEQETSTKESV